MIQFASSFAVGAGRLDGNGTGSSGGVVAGSKFARVPSAPVSPTAWARSSETCASASSVLILLEAGMFAAEFAVILRTDGNGTGSSGGVVAASKFARSPLSTPFLKPLGTLL